MYSLIKSWFYGDEEPVEKQQKVRRSTRPVSGPCSPPNSSIMSPSPRVKRQNAVRRTESNRQTERELFLPPIEERPSPRRAHRELIERSPRRVHRAPSNDIYGNSLTTPSPRARRLGPSNSPLEVCRRTMKGCPVTTDNQPVYDKMCERLTYLEKQRMMGVKRRKNSTDLARVVQILTTTSRSNHVR